MENNNGLVECLLCHEWFYHITWTHLIYIHGYSTWDYQQEFPGTPMQSDEYIEARIDPLRGKTQPPELCKLRSKLATEQWERYHAN